MKKQESTCSMKQIHLNFFEESIFSIKVLEKMNSLLSQWDIWKKSNKIVEDTFGEGLSVDDMFLGLIEIKDGAGAEFLCEEILPYVP